MYVAKPQLFSLALASSFAQSPQIPVWANIFDVDLKVVYHLSSLSNQFRTGNSVLLMPGTYYLQLGARFDASTAPQQATVRLLGTADSDPLGPAPVDPASTPIFGCPDSPDKFCYPPDFETTEPFALLPEPPFELPTTSDLPIDLPAGDGFFGTNFQRSNIALPLDSNNDGIISSLDALLIINRLNAFGSGRAPAPPVNLGGMLDTNNDGFITSIDALLVINRLNQPRAGKAAGHLVAETLSSFLISLFLRSSAFQSGWFDTLRNLETQRKGGKEERQRVYRLRLARTTKLEKLFANPNQPILFG